MSKRLQRKGSIEYFLFLLIMGYFAPKKVSMSEMITVVHKNNLLPWLRWRTPSGGSLCGSTGGASWWWQSSPQSSCCRHKAGHTVHQFIHSQSQSPYNWCAVISTPAPCPVQTAALCGKSSLLNKRCVDVLTGGSGGQGQWLMSAPFHWLLALPDTTVGQSNCSFTVPLPLPPARGHNRLWCF